MATEISYPSPQPKSLCCLLPESSCRTLSLTLLGSVFRALACWHRGIPTRMVREAWLPFAHSLHQPGCTKKIFLYSVFLQYFYISICLYLSRFDANFFKLMITNTLKELLNFRTQFLWERVILNTQYDFPQDLVHIWIQGVSFSLCLSNKCIECVSVKHWPWHWGHIDKIQPQPQGAHNSGLTCKNKGKWEVQRGQGWRKWGRLRLVWQLFEVIVSESFKIQNAYWEKNYITRKETQNTSKMQNNL